MIGKQHNVVITAGTNQEPGGLDDVGSTGVVAAVDMALSLGGGSRYRPALRRYVVGAT